ncbi:MAG: thiamine pyrophosphate-binding protein [Betaproteobacteria bacterium]|nr:thiamine pyrophosphate-binding protein [Betaproteobacteria bacterium]
MSNLKVYEVMAQAFVAEGVDTHFALMGNANMYWSSLLAQKHGVRTIHARHEHCACAMAAGYSRATGKIGVASVTCGPGFTQIMTELACAVRGNTPLVIFGGDTQLNASWSIHELDMGPLAVATGAHYVPMRHIDRVLDCVREAFHVARSQRRPVVLGVPMDLQQQPFPYLPDYKPSTDLGPTPQRPQPDPELVDQVVEMIAAAKKPIFIGGRGALRSGAGASLEALAEQCGALLATSLPAKGLFDHNPFGIGIAGAFAGNLARELFAESDLVIGAGVGLGHYTTEGGYLYPNARVVQIDTNPRGLWQGLRVADLHIRADAKASADAILTKLRERRVSLPGLRTPALAQRIAGEVVDPKEYPVEPNTIDPRTALLELDRVVPKDWDIVVGNGHFTNFVLTHMRGRPAERWHVINDFGAIGSGLAAAIGVTVTRNNGKVLLIEGDGSLLMHIQELETIKRHGLQLLMCILNDGAYGAEAHKFRAQKMDASESIHGRGDLAAVAKGFGLRGATVTALGRFEALLREHQKSDIAQLWDVHIADKIPSAQYRRVHFGES